jgi:hypothetical protein
MAEEGKNAIIVRSKVVSVSRYGDYKQTLREDFVFSCAYCAITEKEGSGISFEIDHYLPQKHRPDLINDYLNLMWSCQICNGNKGQFVPTGKLLEKGLSIIKPDEEDPREHFELKGDKLEPKTERGGFNIKYLLLNRLNLRRLRNLRRRFWESNEYISFGMHELINLSVDKFPPNVRLAVLKLKSKVEDRVSFADETTKEFIEPLCRSINLDEDKEKKKQLKARMEFLKENNAISHEPKTKRGKTKK